MNFFQQVEKRLLQLCVLLGACVPVLAGGMGALHGYAWLIENQWARHNFPLFLGEFAPGLDLDSQFRYLSGLLLAVGFGFWSCVPEIETKTERFQLLTAIVFIGGLARLTGFFAYSANMVPMPGAFIMELLVTPLLCLWQWRVAQVGR